MKKLINDPADVVGETLDGLALAHPRLVEVFHDPLYVLSREAPVPGTVAVLGGGGSGHEPMHVGFVGPGMLSAAVPGPIFTSPTPDPILAATRAVDTGAGVLYLVKNYTGDVLNFETAAELAAAERIAVRTVVVGDDVAVRNSPDTAGRRGVAGVLIAEKIAGASAQRGDDLDEVAAVAERVAAGVRSMGVALRAGTAPHLGRPGFVLADDEVELGVGIHGERGRERVAMASADRLVDRILEPVLDDLAPARGSRVLLLVNGMGGTPLAELYIVLRRAAELLAGRGVVLERSLVGSYATSLEMSGVSVTLLVLDDELLSLWDAPVHTAALRWGR